MILGARLLLTRNMEQVMDDKNDMFDMFDDFDEHTTDKRYVLLAMDYVRRHNLDEARQLFKLADSQWELITNIVFLDDQIALLNVIYFKCGSENIKNQVDVYIEKLKKYNDVDYGLALERPLLPGEDETDIYKMIKDIQVLVYEDLDLAQMFEFIIKQMEQA